MRCISVCYDHSFNFLVRSLQKGYGTAKVLLIGNSYGYRTFPVLHKLFAGRYAEFRLFTKSCESFSFRGTKTSNLSARMFLNKDPLDSQFDYAKLARRVIRHSKPDLIFVIEK